MLYQHLKTTKKVKKYFLPILPIIIVLFFVMWNIKIPTSLTNTVHTIASPVWKMRDSITKKINTISNLLKTKEGLIEENEKLHKDVTALYRETFTIKELEKENDRLLNLLGRINQHNELLPASVIHGVSFSPYDTFIIDLGSNNNIRKNMLVVTSEKIAVGKIEKVFEKTSIVKLFSSPELKTNIVINSTTTTNEVVLGYGGGTMKMSVPRDTDASINDIVTLQTFSAYVLGNIVSIEISPEDAYKTIFIQSPVNMYKIRYVLIDTSHIWKTPQVDTEIKNTENDF